MVILYSMCLCEAVGVGRVDGPVSVDGEGCVDGSASVFEVLILHGGLRFSHLLVWLLVAGIPETLVLKHAKKMPSSLA